MPAISWQDSLSSASAEQTILWSAGRVIYLKNWNCFAAMRYVSPRMGTIIARIEPGGEESSCFSGEVDPPLDRHELGNRSMLSPRCKLREPEFSLLVHLTKGILGIHLREQSARL